MKHWHETTTIVKRVLALAAAGGEAALATVVRIDGSAYRRPGAKLLIETGGSTLGGVSGGCLEADVREVALQVLRENKPRLRHYDTGTDEHTVWGLGLGCNGSVDVFIQPFSTPEKLALVRHLAELLSQDAPFAVTTVIDGPSHHGGALVTTQRAHVESTGSALLDTLAIDAARISIGNGQSNVQDLGEHRLFTDTFVPPPWLLVVGAGDDAMPLVSLAAQMGFRVIVVDHRPAYLSSDRFPSALRLERLHSEDDLAGLPLHAHSYAVVMNHSLIHDREWVKRLLASAIGYVGVLGPRERTGEIVQWAGGQRTERVYGPVGIDVGADGPEQVALSIVAELLAVHTGRGGQHLRNRGGAIHAG